MGELSLTRQAVHAAYGWGRAQDWRQAIALLGEAAAKDEPGAERQLALVTQGSLEAMLTPPAQEAFAEKMGYLPTVENAPLHGKTGEQLALPADLKLIPPDYSIVGKLQSSTSEWWKKTMRSS